MQDSSSPAIADSRYRWHIYSFALGMLFAWVGMLLTSAWMTVGLLVVALSGACWVGSGVLALMARRHMFRLTSRMSSGAAFVSASERGSLSTWVVGGILLLLGVCSLAVAALRLI